MGYLQDNMSLICMYTVQSYGSDCANPSYISDTCAKKFKGLSLVITYHYLKLRMGRKANLCINNLIYYLIQMISKCFRIPS